MLTLLENNVTNIIYQCQELIPVEFIVECRSDCVDALGRLFLVTHFGTIYGVLVRFYPKIDGLTYQVNIRGNKDQLSELSQAVAQFCHLGKIDPVSPDRLVFDRFRTILKMYFSCTGLHNDEDGNVVPTRLVYSPPN